MSESGFAGFEDEYDWRGKSNKSFNQINQSSDNYDLTAEEIKIIEEVK